MNTQEAIQQHRQICDELYELALEENRFLQQNRRLPGAELTERKRAALARLDSALNALRGAAPESARDPQRRSALEKTQARIMQILQIDRENEQLLVRYSLSRGAPAQGAPEAAALQRTYSKGS
jgi:hypothetical protein